MLNEGIDVPSVDFIAFLRVTHSRKIFVQQMGRGLRKAEGKDGLVAVDFVAELKRIAEVFDTQKKYKKYKASDLEELKTPNSFSVIFAEDDRKFLTHWALDVAEVIDSGDPDLPLPDFPSRL